MFTQNNTNFALHPSVTSSLHLSMGFEASMPCYVQLCPTWPVGYFYPQLYFPQTFQFIQYPACQTPNRWLTQTHLNQLNPKVEGKSSLKNHMKLNSNKQKEKEINVSQSITSSTPQQVKAKEKILFQKGETLKQSQQRSKPLFTDEENEHRRIKNIVCDFLKKQKEREKIYEKLKNENKFIVQILQEFDNLVKSFRKTREQIHKIIIRRVIRFHRYGHCGPRAKKFIGFGGCKSMSNHYITKLFSDMKFIESYKAVSVDIYKQFESENNRKIENFVERIVEKKSKKRVKLVIESLNIKGQMPWPQVWMQKFHEVLVELQERYVSKKIKK